MSIPKSRPPGRGQSGGQYFDPAPSSASRPREIELTLPDRVLKLQSDAGVFSGGHVDTGTAVLLDKAPPPPPVGDLLDLGCGYGAIALWLAVSSPRARVWAVDVNPRALQLCRENAERNRLANVTACLPDEVPAEVLFAAIYSNPPIRIGKEALHQLLLRWLARLEPGAAAHLVVQHYLGSDSLARWLTANGHPTRKLGSRKAFRILEVLPRPG